MSIELTGLSEINGPLVVLEGASGGSYDEMVRLHLPDGSFRTGRIVQIEKDRCVIQVFEGTNGLGLTDTSVTMTGRPMELAL